MAEKKQVPMTHDDGSPLFTWPSDKPQLIGARCKDCGEIVFPRRPQCPKCFTETMEEILLSTKGKVYSSTISYLAPWTMYKGKVPYAFGHVQLPEKVLIPCKFSPELKSGELSPLPIGTEVELSIEEFGEDEAGEVVMMHTFRPIKRRA